MRLGLTAVGSLFLVQGIAKALDPVSFMAGLDAFHVIAPAALSPLSLGALGLGWTVLELLAGVAMLYGGLARAPRRELPRAGIELALGLSFTYLALDAGALARRLTAARSLVFGAYLAQPLSWLVVFEQALAIALLAWLFTRITASPGYFGTSWKREPAGRRRGRRLRRLLRVARRVARRAGGLVLARARLHEADVDLVGDVHRLAERAGSRARARS